MKSPLVDALRAANDNDDALSLEKTIAPGLPATSPEEIKPANEAASATQLDADLELLETVAATAEIEPADNDAEFPDEQPLPEASLHEGRVAAAPAGAAMFERAAKWMPAVCLLLAACSAAAFSGWSNVTGMSGSVVLAPQPGSGNASAVDDSPATDAPAARFEFIDVAPVPAARADRSNVPRNETERQSTPVGIVRSTGARTPRAVAGLTDVDGANFSSIAVIYQAFVSGQISRAALDRLLNSAATTGNEDAELEIKLLLQRYPDSVSLHNALGTVLANRSRWPESRVAYERAAELARSAPGGTLQ